MSLELKDILTSASLNPQKFSSIRCKHHNQNFISHVNIQNNSQQKLLCSYCVDEIVDGCKSFTAATTTPRILPPNFIEIKQFLKGLYSFCTLEDSDPERFKSEMIACIEGEKPQEKLRLFLDSVGRIREEVSTEILTAFSESFDAFERDINSAVSSIRETFEDYLQSEISLLLSRETLSFKQFKERASKVVLSAVKTASLEDSHVAFDSAVNCIERFHSGKLELSFAKEHLLKSFQQFQSELDSTFMQSNVKKLAKSMAASAEALTASHQLMPRKNAEGRQSKQVNFAYLQNCIRPFEPISTNSIQRSNSGQQINRLVKQQFKSSLMSNQLKDTESPSSSSFVVSSPLPLRRRPVGKQNSEWGTFSPSYPSELQKTNSSLDLPKIHGKSLSLIETSIGTPASAQTSMATSTPAVKNSLASTAASSLFSLFSSTMRLDNSSRISNNSGLDSQLSATTSQPSGQSIANHLQAHFHSLNNNIQTIQMSDDDKTLLLPLTSNILKLKLSPVLRHSHYIPVGSLTTTNNTLNPSNNHSLTQSDIISTPQRNSSGSSNSSSVMKNLIIRTTSSSTSQKSPEQQNEYSANPRQNARRELSIDKDNITLPINQRNTDTKDSVRRLLLSKVSEQTK